MGIFDLGNPLGMALASLMGSPGAASQPPAPPPRLESNYQSGPLIDNSGWYGPANPPMPTARPNPGQNLPSGDLASAVAPPQGAPQDSFGPPTPPNWATPSMDPAIPPGQVPLPIPRGSFGPARPNDMASVDAPPSPQVAGPGAPPMPPMPGGGGGMPSPGTPSGAPPQTPAGPWLSGIFGSDPRRTAQMAGSLGAGLKSVGQNWNKPGLAAFAGSAGAAIEGGTGGDERQTKDEREAKQEALRNQQFRETQIHNDQQYQTAQRRLDIAQQVGTVRSRADAWRNSDLGRLNMADQEIGHRIESYRKEFGEDLKDPSPKNRKAAQQKQDEYEAKTRADVYKRYGVDPNKIDNLKKLGTSYKTPFEPKSEDEFHALVKPPRPDPNNPGQMLPGDYYKNPRNGRIYRRDAEAPPPADAPGGILNTPDPNSVGGGFDQPQQQI